MGEEVYRSITMFKILFILFLNIQFFEASFIEFNTKDGKVFENFFPNSLGFANFRIKAKSDVYIALLPNNFLSDPMFTIIVGAHNNTKSVIRKNRSSTVNVATNATNLFLSESEFRSFWIRWNKTIISVGKDGDLTPFLSYKDPDAVSVLNIGFASYFPSSWILETIHHWIPNTQSLKNLFPAGQGTTPLYVGRGKIGNNLIPGYTHATSYVAVAAPNGTAVAIKEYEVLSDLVGGNWISINGSDIPCNAIEGGYTDFGETLYIGRAVHGNDLIIGKVVPSDGKLYAYHGTDVISFDKFAILVQD